MTANENPAFGTVAWARRRDGRMTSAERLRELMAASRVLLGSAPARLRIALGISNRRAISLDLDQIVIPDSKIALEAEEECREASPERLLNHCLRTYAWGMLLAQIDGKRPDPELLWVAAMLHDLCLTDRHRDANPMPCFGARAGILAQEWAGARGWPQERSTTLADSISLHLNSRVDATHGPEAQLLHAGAALDVIGQNSWRLAPDTVESVLERYPRRNFLDGLEDFKAEGHPGTRTRLLLSLGFARLARRSPIER